MTKPIKSQSLADRKARQVRAQASAMKDIQEEASHRREQSTILRKQRLAKEKVAASNFQDWRSKLSPSGQ